MRCSQVIKVFIIKQKNIPNATIQTYEHVKKKLVFLVLLYPQIYW